MMTECGSLDWIDLSDTVGKHFNVGTPTSRWYFTDGKTQGKVKVIHSDCVEYCDIEDLYYLPPVSTKIERNLYKKIINNTDGDVLIVVRGQKIKIAQWRGLGIQKFKLVVLECWDLNKSFMILCHLKLVFGYLIMLGDTIK
jgi:hypothetical protein